MKLGKLHFFEFERLPDNPKPYEVHFIENGDYAEAIVTNREGKVKMMGNSDMIKKIVKEVTPKTYTGYSDSYLDVSGGIKTFRTQENLAYVVGQQLRLTYNGSNYMQGAITSYYGDTMQVDCRYKVGSGYYNSWILSPGTDFIIPDGGTTGQVLTKASDSSYHTAWAPAPSGGGIGGGGVGLVCGRRTTGGGAIICGRRV